MPKIRIRKSIFLAAAAACALFLCSCSALNSGDKSATAADFAGEWEDSGTILDIWVDDDGICHAEVTRTEDESTVSFWSFSGEVKNGTFAYEDAVKTVATYNSDGDVSDETAYENGSGSVIKSGENLKWNDKNENAGKGLKFTYVGEY